MEPKFGEREGSLVRNLKYILVTLDGLAFRWLHLEFPHSAQHKKGEDFMQ